jgi:zinc protease
MRRNDPDYFSLYVGNHILGGNGLVSQLSEEVRENRGLSYSVYSYFLPMRELGPFMIGAQTKNASAEEALEAMRQVVQRFIEQGPTAEELRAAKLNITGGFPLRIASNSKILSYLAVIGFYDMPLDHLDTFNAKVQAVTAEQIRDAFRRRLDLDRLVTVVVGGEAAPVATPVSTPASAQPR